MATRVRSCFLLQSLLITYGDKTSYLYLPLSHASESRSVETAFHKFSSLPLHTHHFK